jgi:YVTN family beta-propeller protein
VIRHARSVVAAAVALALGIIAGVQIIQPRKALCATPQSGAQTNPLVTGRRIALPPLGTQQDVGNMPMNMVLSPDGRYAVVTTMGYNERLSVIDATTGHVVSHLNFPNKEKANPATNGLYYGLAFAPDGTLYAAQGSNDTISVLSVPRSGVLAETGIIKTEKGDFPSGLATDSRGYLYVANNDPNTFDRASSVAIYKSGAEVGRYSFASSFGATPNFPLAVAALADGSKVYVASQRDSAVYVLDTHDPAKLALLCTISTGSHPVALLLNKKQSLLYVANAHSDTVSVVSTANDKVVDTLLVRSGRLSKLAGATPLGLAVSPDGRSLYIALGDMNAIAVASVNPNRAPGSKNPVERGNGITLRGYIPAGWYPTAVVATKGDKLLFANAKGTQPRVPAIPRRGGGTPQHQSLLEGNVAFIAAPNNRELADFTKLVLANNGLNEPETSAQTTHADAQHAPFKEEDSLHDMEVDHRLDALGLKSGKIRHVIYVIKENRTYDQVLGDISQGNGDPSLVLFGRDVTPNQHALAERFVLLDNFYAVGEVSGDGWPWSTQSMANEYVIKNVPYAYSGRDRNYDFEGQNNGYLAGGYPAKDPDGKTLSPLFPNGTPAIPDVAEAPGGHLWDAVRAAGLSYRNYGFFYSFGLKKNGLTTIPDNYPTAKGLQPSGHDLNGISDFDYRRFDLDYPDSMAPVQYGCPYPHTAYGHAQAPSRYAEWYREFQLMLAKDPTGNSVPAFMTIRLPHDHTQGLKEGKFTPSAEVADNDYGVGQLVDAVSRSPIWNSTAIFIIEDDAQNGPDHVDEHRSTAYVISPYVKAHALDHRFYNTDSVLKTIELLLGIGPLTQYDAIAQPIHDFDDHPSNMAPFTAMTPSRSIICEQTPPLSAMKNPSPMRTLALQSAKMDFDHPDSAPAGALNRIIWKSVKGWDSRMPQPKAALVHDDD